MRNTVLSGHNRLNAEWLAEEIALLVSKEKDGIILPEALIPAIQITFMVFEKKVAASKGISPEEEN